MKRNVLISGEFTMTDVSNPQSAQRSPHPKKSAAARIAALKAAGVDVSNYFPVSEEMIIKVENGIPSQVTDDDPVFSRICSGGYIAHSKLFRRWVMAQMFRMLREMEEHGNNFTETLQQRGYDYSWKMLQDELLAQYKMSKHGDCKAFSERNRWFDRDVATEMARDYVAHLCKLVDTAEIRHCKGRPYIRIFGTNVFTDEAYDKIVAPVRKAYMHIWTSNNPYTLYKAVENFNRMRHILPWRTKMSKDFVNAYKGAGAYFTMKNLILFHGARFCGLPTESQSLERLENMTRRLDGWELLGGMKQLIADSGINVARKIDEWKK